MTDRPTAQGAGSKRWWQGAPRGVDGWVALSIGAGVRLLMVAWAVPRFAPAADGKFYHVVATRIAAGHGYTWLWPDGAVTFAAHYPVGYPAMLGGLYAIFGDHFAVAMLLNASLGALSVLAVHRVVAQEAARGGALLAALAVALHPTLVAYTPALMTEGVMAALLALAAWTAVAAARHRGGSWPLRIALGGLLGVATLVRPQTLLLTPVFGALSVGHHSETSSTGGGRGRLLQRSLAAAGVTVVVLLTCLPWSFRNCSRMGRCLFVSANAGWNLVIGSGPGATGGWVPIEQAGLPSECREVFDESEKDYCFVRAAVRRIRSAPGAWLALSTEKLRQTFDASGTPGGYLHGSNPTAFPPRLESWLVYLEIGWQRSVLAIAVAALALMRGPFSRLRRGLGIVLAPFLVTRLVWVSYLGLSALAVLQGGGKVRHPVALLAASAVVVTAATHVVFFGAGRYSMVCYALVAALAGLVLRGPAEAVGSTPGEGRPGPGSNPISAA